MLPDQRAGARQRVGAQRTGVGAEPLSSETKLSNVQGRAGLSLALALSLSLSSIYLSPSLASVFFPSPSLNLSRAHRVNFHDLGNTTHMRSCLSWCLQ